MRQIIIDTNALKLPQEFAEKIETEKVMIKQVNDGILITPFCSHPRRLRGMLKGSGFSTEKFFLQKQSDKELEQQ